MAINSQQFKVKKGQHFKLSELNTTAGKKNSQKKGHKKKLLADILQIASWQYKLFAENRQSLLIILQGMDSAGKDSVITHIMSGVNAQGVLVQNFKKPSTIDLEHDYLWRHYQKLPERGQIVIFNRSHYENVLISKVHPEIVLAERVPGIDSVNKVNKKFWTTRYNQINEFEEVITKNGIHVLKFFLHLSKKEQAKRFLERIRNKEKHWKFSSADIQERAFWDQYQQAYEDAFNHTSTKIAPWYIIPADDKWFTHLLIGKIILEKLKKINPSFPPIDEEEKKLMKKAKRGLLNGK